MRVNFLLLLLPVILCPDVINGALMGSGGYRRMRSRNYIVKCCNYESCTLPVGGALKTTTLSKNDVTRADTTAMVFVEETESDEPPVTEYLKTTKVVVIDAATTAARPYVENLVTTMVPNTGSNSVPVKTTSYAATTVSNNGPISTITNPPTTVLPTTLFTTTTTPNTVLPTTTFTTTTTPTTVLPTSSFTTTTTTTTVLPTTTLTTTTTPTTVLPTTPFTTITTPTTVLPTTTFTTTTTPTTVLPTTTTPTTATTLSPFCVQPCPESCDCNGDALVLDAEGEMTSETIMGNFILKCGEKVNTTAYYHSRPNVTNFNNTEMVCCSVCSLPVSKSSSGKRKRAVTSGCIYDFQHVYLENVNDSVKVVFTMAGQRGDCALLVGSTFSISWKTVKFCSPGVKYFNSNDTACSVVNSWQTCGTQIQNQKLPTDSYCQIVAPTMCGQMYTYTCIFSNNVTTFQTLTQGLLLERVSTWAYFLYRDTAAMMVYNTAATYCESRMMDLAVFDTIAELDAVLPWFVTIATQTYGSTKTHAIIGLDHITTLWNFVVTKTGAPAPALKWIPLEPDNYGGNQRCVCLVANYPSAGIVGMADIGCADYYLFICKVPPEFVWTLRYQ